MTFGAVFPRVMRPAFGPGLAAASGGVDWSQWFDHCWVAKGAASLAASYSDLVGSQTLTATGSPTWSAAGWAGFTIADYLHTGIIPAAGYTIMARGSGGSTSNNYCLIGSLNGFNAGLVLHAGTGKRFWHGTSSTTISGNLTAGVLAMAGQTGYVNGVSVGTVGNTTFSGALVEMLIGARNRNDSTTDVPWPGTIEVVGIKLAVLDASAVAVASAAMAAL